MEILNNIWTTLSTENVQLVNTLLIPASIVESFLTLMLFVNLLNIYKNIKLTKPVDKYRIIIFGQGFDPPQLHQFDLVELFLKSGSFFYSFLEIFT